MIAYNGRMALAPYGVKRSDWMNEEWVNKNMSIREARIWLMFLEYECPKDKIEELYDQVDKRYGNNLTEKQKFEYVSHILQKTKAKQSIRDDLATVYYAGDGSAIAVIGRPLESFSDATLKVFSPIIGEVIK